MSGVALNFEPKGEAAAAEAPPKKTPSQ